MSIEWKIDGVVRTAEFTGRRHGANFFRSYELKMRAVTYDAWYGYIDGEMIGAADTPTEVESLLLDQFVKP